MREIIIMIVGFSLISLANAQNKPDYQQLVNQAYAKYQQETRGHVANYIPALAKYDPKLYGIALVTVDGKVYIAGDAKVKFPLESLSKVFTLALAIEQHGVNVVLDKIGANATG